MTDFQIPAAPSDPARIAERLEAADIDTVIVGVPDANGVLRARRLPAWRFVADPAAAITFCEHLFTMDITAEPIPRPEGHAGWWPNWEQGGRGDFHGHPDLGTLRVVPWLPRMALVLCDCAFLDGTPVQLTSRAVLRDVCDQLAARDLSAKVALEYEFYLFHDNAPQSARELRPLSTQNHTYWSSLRAGLDDHLLGELRRHLEAADLTVDSWVAESGPGQYEMTLVPTDPLEAADRAFLFRHAVKEFAGLHDLIASFMPRPLPDRGGCGMHIHCSLWSAETGENAFFDPDADRRLTGTALHCAGGVLEALPDLAAVYAPTINAYKRFLPDMAAGDRVAWGVENKSIALRAVNATANGCRLELRTPSADADPYLVAAAFLVSGLRGIEHATDPPQECVGNGYTNPGVGSIPLSLAEALDRFGGGETARDCFGEDFVAYYAAGRRHELDQFGRAVTDWEIGRYLR